MATAEKELSKRIADIRRRHYGARGKGAFAAQLGVSAEEYARYERGAVPSGEVLVRICELTGEDLQWLLTGVAARGTVVIAGTRGRHQELLARLARLLDERPELARPLESFVRLLVDGSDLEPAAKQRLENSDHAALIPIYAATEPVKLEDADAADGEPDGGHPLLPTEIASLRVAAEVRIMEPDPQGTERNARAVELVEIQERSGTSRLCVRDELVTAHFPQAFALRVNDDTMAPMIATGDAVVVSPTVDPELGEPAVCIDARTRGSRCRIWLGSDADRIRLGRCSDGCVEEVAPADVLHSFAVLFRVCLAA